MNPAGSILQAEKYFFTIWQFSDFRELYDWLFVYYNEPHDKGKIREVAQVLGEKRDSRPLLLEDKHVLTVLRKSEKVS